VALLPPDERRAIGLKRQGCSREQIAALLDRSPESIHGLLRHAYARLRRNLGPLRTARE
jgi:DNA-directed RNA polymerase specialized sigma24 family protein